MRRLLIIFLFCSLSRIAPAQPGTLVFDHYGMSDGFLTRTSRSVVKTSDGMVWITTDKGLVRFDSEEFRFYRHDPADPRTIHSDLTDEMVGGRNNTLWIVTGGALDRFDPATGIFSHCLFMEGDQQLTEVNPESVCYDSSTNRVWVGTWRGLYYNENGATVFQKAPVSDEDSRRFAGMTFNAITRDRSGRLWLGNTYGFFLYDHKSGKISRYHIPGQDDRLEDDDGVFCLYATPADILWIGTWNKGLVRYEMGTGKAEQFFYSDHRKQQNGILSIAATGLPSERDRVWVATTGHGLCTFDHRTRSFSSYLVAGEGDKYGIRGQVNRLLPTASEGMWITSEDGLHRYDYAGQLFRRIDLGRLQPILQKAFLPDWLGFVASGNGTDSLLLVSVPYVGTYVYDVVRERLDPLPSSLLTLLSGSVFARLVDASGTWWISADRHGLLGYSWKEKRMVFADSTLFGRPWQWATLIREDRQKRLWFGAYNGLYRFDDDRRRILPVSAVNDSLALRKVSAEITGITEDNRGWIWFTTAAGPGTGSLLGCYRPQTGRVNIYDDRRSGDGALPFKADFRDMAGQGDRLYIATLTGLLIADISGEHPRYYLRTEEQGLSSGRLEQVLADRKGNIWCSTEFGVSCYLPHRDYFINYFGHSSNLGSAKSPHLFLSPASGVIYTCQQGALSWFDPGSIQEAPPPALRFAGLRLFNKAYPADLSDGASIRLKHHQNMLTFFFTAMSFRDARNNQYAYRLKGLEQEWNTTKDNYASYAHLAPGAYTLQVRAANSSGVWTPQPLELEIVIRPPFWRTAWFIGLCFLTASLVLFAVIRYRLRVISERMALRNKIAADLHDEIGSTLTSIHILSSVSAQAVDTHPGKAREMLAQITEQSRMIQQNMSDIVWAIRPDNDRLGNLLVRMREYAAQTLEPLGILTQLQTGEELLKESLSLQARKELLLIYKEAVNNIARHSGATRAEVIMFRKDGMLHLEIRDNGRWKQGNHTGTGSRSMQQRAAGLGGQLQLLHDEQGTTVRLQFPLT